MSGFDRNRAVFALVRPKAEAWAKRNDCGFVSGELFTEVAEIIAGIPRTFSVKNTAAKVWIALGLGS